MFRRVMVIIIHFERLKNSIAANNNLWILLWLLALLNFVTFFSFVRSLTFPTILSIILIAFLGVGGIKFLKASQSHSEEEISEELQENISGVMGELRVLGSHMFDKEINRISGSLLASVQQDFSSGLSWLWEGFGSFVNAVEEGVSEITSVVENFASFSDERAKLLRQINENLDAMKFRIINIKNSRENDFFKLEASFSQQVNKLKEEIESEQEIYYDYIYKVLVTQAKKQEEDIDIASYFDIDKLGQQLAATIEKSLEARMLGFQEKIIKEMEEFSADVVGKMQNNALQFTNTFKEIQDLIERLLNDCQEEPAALLKRLDEAYELADRLQERGKELMVTLAWHDILVEKRWQEIQENLLIVRDKVNESIGEDVKEFILGLLNEEIPEAAKALGEPQKPVYDSLLDAELAYQLYKGDKLSNIIKDGVYPLLQYVRPLEILLNKTMRLSDEGISTRRLIKSQIMSGEYNKYFERIQQLISEENPKLLQYLENTFPKAFLAFCNNPYIKQKPDDLNQAAWGLFLNFARARESNEQVYLLVGLLLIIHQLRNLHIHPLKSKPVYIDNANELEYIRSASYKAINLILITEVKGLGSIKHA